MFIRIWCVCRCTLMLVCFGFWEVFALVWASRWQFDYLRLWFNKNISAIKIIWFVLGVAHAMCTRFDNLLMFIEHLHAPNTKKKNSHSLALSCCHWLRADIHIALVIFVFLTTGQPFKMTVVALKHLNFDFNFNFAKLQTKPSTKCASHQNEVPPRVDELNLITQYSSWNEWYRSIDNIRFLIHTCVFC